MHSLYKTRVAKKIIIFLFFFVFSHIFINAQTGSRIHTIVMDRFARGINFDQFDLFTTRDKRTSAELGDYQSLALKRDIFSQLKQQHPEQFQVSVPIKNNVVTLAFIKSNIIDDSAKFIYIDVLGEHIDQSYTPPVFYHGIIKDADTSFVTASVTSDAIHFFISYRKQNIQIGSVNDRVLTTDDYGVFEKLPGNNEAIPFTCGTNEAGNQQLSSIVPTSPSGATAYGGKVVRCFFDCADTFYLQNGSVAATYNRISTLFNQAALLYANEQINTSISQIRVWTIPDPYNHTSRNLGLSSFKNYVQNNYTGNLAMLCDYSANSQSGLADTIGGLCLPYSSTIAGPYIYNDLNYDNYFSNFPVTADAPQAYLIIHEMGHILGSRHTHWCGWVGGPIDNCAPAENGPCSAGPTPTQGTMMSYCCTNSALGINFNAGFGSQPGNAIRNHINNSGCVGNGTTVCDSTLYLQGAITNTDYTRFEVSNQITATTVLSSGANVLFDAGKTVLLYPGFIANTGSTLRIVNEGCGGLYRTTLIRKILHH